MLSEYCIKTPGTTAGFYAPVKEGLRDYVIPIVEKVFSDCPSNQMPIFDSRLTLNFSNGSTIIFRGSNNQQHRIRRGNDLQIAAIDEARDVDDLDALIDSVVIPSLFTTSGRLIISSTPADTDDHPLHTIKQQAEREGWISHYNIYDAYKYDPIDFPIERIETWRKETTDDVAWQREYMALWVKDPTKIIIPEWDDKYTTLPGHDDFFHLYHKYTALDSGVRDKTAGILGYYDFKRAKLIIEAEFTLQNEQVITHRIAQEVKEAEERLGYQSLHDKKDPDYKYLQNREKVYRCIADNNNLILVNDLDSLYGLDFYPTKKDELVAMINLVREWVKDGKILVDKSCRELIGCLSNAIWDKNKKELARSKVYGHFDALMALVYLVRNVDTHTNPIPLHYKKSYATHNIPMTSNIPTTSSYELVRLLGVPKFDVDKSRKNFVNGNS